MAETPSEVTEPLEPITQSQHKTCVLKASIHCEGCKRKVKKILTQIHGVEFVDVDTKQQKVTVIGNVETEALIRKLVKSGKQAQPWPQKQSDKQQPAEKQQIEKQSEKVQKTPKMKEKSETQSKAVEIQKVEENEKGKEKSIPDSTPTEQNPQAKPKPQLATKIGESSNTGEKTGEPVAKTGGEPSPVQNDKKSEEGGDMAAEKTGGSGVGKKKKKKGQNRNSDPNSSSGVRVRAEKKVEEHVPEMRTSHSPPRQQYYPAQHHDGYYSMPAPPVYGMSYNTAHPTTNYTASYYAAPPQPYSYAYAYPGSSESEAPHPSYGHEARTNQPLESFEMFSDENPNGCIVS